MDLGRKIGDKTNTHLQTQYISICPWTVFVKVQQQQQKKKLNSRLINKD